MANIQIIGNINSIQTLNRFDSSDFGLSNVLELNNKFDINRDYIEYHIYDINGISLINSDYNYSKFKINGDIIEIDPISDIKIIGFSTGDVKTQYNFYRRVISGPSSSDLFIKEISSDRTELRIASTALSNEYIENKFNELKKEIDESSYFKTYLANFKNNIQSVIVNIDLNKSENGYEILLKLYHPLLEDILNKSTLYITEDLVDPYIFDINLDKLIFLDPLPKLRGPNFSIKVKNKNNNITSYTTLSDIYSNQNSASYNQVQSFITSASIDINVDYTQFDNFIKFSSVEQRIKNFYNKVEEIQYNQNYINTYSSSINTTSSLIGEINNAQNQISNIISNFDGYEYCLYYESSSYAWPKSTSTKPFILYNTGSSQVQNWVTASLLFASNYDINNQDYLINTLPLFIQEDQNNEQYFTFIKMIGHYFDNIFIYIKSITDIHKTDNNVEEGISKDLVYEALQSLGLEVYNNMSHYDIKDYIIGLNSGSVDDYTNLSDNFLNNIPKQDLFTEIMKRLYHNFSLLFKSKGTSTSIDYLENIFGISGSVLNIKEYGVSDDKINPFNYNNNISIDTSSLSSGVLSPYININTGSKIENVNYVEIAFSPQNQINTTISNYISSSYPNFDIDDYIGNPTSTYSSSYIGLSEISNNVFKSNFNYTFDYGGFIKLIKMFDNSMFKYIKNLIPAKTSIATGIVFKSPDIERIKFKNTKPQLDNSSQYSGSYSAPVISEDRDYIYLDYVSGDKHEFYCGDISGSITNTYQYFDQHVNPYLMISKSFDENTFNHTDFNVLLNNVSSNISSSIKYKLEPIYVDGRFNSYKSNSLAELQDSYETLKSYMNSRYDGIKLTSQKYNVYTNGDISFGKNAVINNNVQKLAVFTQVSESIYLPKRNNIAIRYLVDEFGQLTELNKENKKWEEIQNTFVLGDNLAISLFDNQKYSDQRTLDGIKQIYSSGYSYYPILYYSNDEKLYFQYTGGSVAKIFSARNKGLSNLFISGSTSPSYSALPSGSKYVVYNVFNDDYINEGNYFTPGNSILQTYASYSVPENGSYSFNVNFNVNLEFPTSGHSGSFTFNIKQNGNIITSQTKEFTSGYNSYLYGYTNTSYPFNYIPTKLTVEPFNGSLLFNETFPGPVTLYDNNNNLIGSITTGETIYGVTESFYNIAVNCGGGDPGYGSYIWNGVSPNKIIYATGSLTLLPNAGTDVSVLSNEFIQQVNQSCGTGLPITQTTSNTVDQYWGYSYPQSVLSTTLNFNTGSGYISINQNDQISFEFILDYISTNNYTASLNEGLLNVSLQANNTGNAPFATSSLSPFISESIAPNLFRLNNSLSNFYGYLSTPYSGSGVPVANSLYAQYGEILYDFTPKSGDILVIEYEGQTQEFNISDVSIFTDGVLNLTVSPDIPQGILNNLPSITKVLFLTQQKDETNLMIRFPKRDGKTSYGFIIPSNLNPRVLGNIDTITKEIKQKLLGEQQSV